jgi:hypothetical protein
MPLTKSFNELVQNRAANDPNFAAALARETVSTPPLTMRCVRYGKPPAIRSAATRTGT